MARPRSGAFAVVPLAFSSAGQRLPGLAGPGAAVVPDGGSWTAWAWIGRLRIEAGPSSPVGPRLCGVGPRLLADGFPLGMSSQWNAEVSLLKIYQILDLKTVG